MSALPPEQLAIRLVALAVGRILSGSVPIRKPASRGPGSRRSGLVVRVVRSGELGADLIGLRGSELGV